MRVYLDLLQELLDKASQPDCQRLDRTGVGTVASFGRQMSFDLQQGFPLLTTKKIHFRSVVYELLWFLRGGTNTGWLNENGVSIWDEWADEQGELGPIYGAQWRKWSSPTGPIDQIAQLIQGLKTDPNSRRHIVSAWNPGALADMALPPCHILFQLYVENGGLSCQIYQRSCDVFLGLPFNIASYALLTHLIADQCGYRADRLVWVGGDVHLYLNHQVAAETQLTRQPSELPTLTLLRKPEQIWEYEFADIRLDDYHCAGAIKADIAV